MTGVLLVANASAGTAEQESIGAAQERLREHDLDVVHVDTDDETDLRQALENDLDDRTLVIAGGDGSVHLAVNLLHELDLLEATPIGIIPLGTGNDLARAAGIPLDDPAAAADVIAQHQPRSTDLILDETDHVVVNASHAGVGAAASARASDMKDRLGPAAYPLGALIEGTTTTGWDLDVILDGDPVPGDGKMLMVGVGNGGCIGGGAQLCPDAELDDGRLDIMVSRATGPLARGAFAAALNDGTHALRDDVWIGNGIEVAISGDPVSHCPDGEFTEPIGSRTYRVEPGAWRLIRP